MGILLQFFSFYIPSDGELISMCDEKNIFKEWSTLVRKDIVQAFRGFVSEDIGRMCSNQSVEAVHTGHLKILINMFAGTLLPSQSNSFLN